MVLLLNHARSWSRLRVAASIGPLFLILVGGDLLLLVFAVAGWGAVALSSALLAPLVLVLAQRPQRGVLALLVLAPFDGLLDLLPHSSALHGWKAVLVASTLLVTFVAPGTTRSSSWRRLPGWSPAVAALGGLGLISAGLVGAGQGLTGLRIDFLYLLLAWAIWRCPLGVAERDRLVTILMVGGVVNGAIGLLEQGLGPVRLHGMGFGYNSTIRFAGGHLRSFGTFPYQAPFAYFLMVVLLVGLSQALTEPSRPRNRLFVVCVPLLLASLLFTFERGAWLGLAVGCLYLGLRRHSGVLLALPLALLVPIYLPGDVTSSALSNRSLGERSSGWAANVNQVLLHPLGAGIGATGATAAKVAAGHAPSVLPLAAATYQPDNYYFKTVYELGVVGLWFLLLFLVAAAVSCDRAAGRLEGRDAALADSVCAFLLATMVASVVATFFEIYPMDLLTWLLLGTVAACAPD